MAVHLLHRRHSRLLSLPAVVTVALVTQGLFLGTIVVSLLKWNLVRPDLGITFFGFANFLKLFQAQEAYAIIANTLLIGGVSLVFSFCIGFAFALLLNREFFGVHVLRALILIPFFTTDVVVGIVFKTLMLHPSFGIAGYLASLLHVAPVDFMGSYAFASVILLIVWQWTPFFVLILLAGLHGLNPELLESADIDGAGAFTTLLRIVVPSLLHHIHVAVLLGLVFILKVFGLIYVTTSGGPGLSTTTLPYHVFKLNQFKLEVGEAASYAVVTVLITLVLLTLVFKYFQKRLASL